MLDFNWFAIRDGDAVAFAMYQRHYSHERYRDNRRARDKRIVGPGERMVLMTAASDALFVWRRMNRPDLAGQSGVNCSIFRNESSTLSSVLIREAMALAFARWPDERLFTYINPRAIRSTNRPTLVRLYRFISTSATNQ